MAHATEAIQDRIDASASDRESLRTKLTLTQFDPTGLERQRHYTRELALRVRQLRKRVEETHKEAESARKEQDRRNSALHLLSNKIRRKSADSRAEAERNSSEVTQLCFQLEKELQELEELQKQANQELQAIEGTGVAHEAILHQLDQIYERIFVDTTFAARVQELEKPAQDVRAAAHNADQRIQVEDSVMESLRMANTKYKSMVDPFCKMLASSQWQGWSMGSFASGTFANEDENMAKILAYIAEADACVDAARMNQPRVEMKTIEIDTEGTPRNSLFRKMVWDPRYLSKMDAYVTDIRRSEKILRGDIDRAYERKRQAEVDRIRAERDLTLARQKLVEETEVLIHQICR